MDPKYYTLIPGEYGYTESRYVLKPEYRYDSTFKNPTPINAGMYNEWERVENTLKTLKNGPYDITDSDYGYGEQIPEIFNRRKTDRIRRQQELDAGTINVNDLKEAIKKNESKYVDHEIRKAANTLMGIYTSTGGKSNKSRKSNKSKKSKKSNKVNKSKKSTKSNKSRKSKK